MQSHYVWWWLITQPRPIWKKAPPGLQRPSHTESRSGLAFGTLMVRTHTLDLTPVAPRSYNPVAIQLLIKDNEINRLLHGVNFRDRATDTLPRKEHNTDLQSPSNQCLWNTPSVIITPKNALTYIPRVRSWLMSSFILRHSLVDERIDPADIILIGTVLCRCGKSSQPSRISVSLGYLLPGLLGRAVRLFVKHAKSEWNLTYRIFKTKYKVSTQWRKFSNMSLNLDLHCREDKS